MKTIVLYYTLGGSTRAEATRIASAMEAEMIEVQETHKRNPFTAFIPGCPHAMKRRASKIKPLGVDLGGFERIVLCCPVWSGYPAPAFNAMAALLPPGKEVEVVLCSAGGETPKSIVGTKNLIMERGCRLISYRDVNTTPEDKRAK